MAKISDPKAQALFETTAEVLLGLAKTFEDFEQKSEKAKKRGRQSNQNVTEQKKSGKAQTGKGDKLQDLLPPERERIHQGQQFDEMQRQKKNPDGVPRDEEES